MPASYCSADDGRFEGPIRVLNVPGDPQEGLIEAAGWAPCETWTRSASQTLPSSAAIERAAASALVTPDGHGWIDLPAEAVAGDRPLRAWLGHGRARGRPRPRIRAAGDGRS